MAGIRPTIHDKCLGFLETEGDTLICAKSRGHFSEQCFDPDRDRYFLPQYKPKANEKETGNG